LPFDLSTLGERGYLYDIDCRGFGSLIRQLEWRTLGVKLQKMAGSLRQPPRAGLLPDVYRNRLMRGAAQAITLSISTASVSLYVKPFGGPASINGSRGRHSSNSSRRTFGHGERFRGQGRSSFEKYDDIIEILTDSFRELAEELGNRLLATVDEPFNRNEFVDRGDRTGPLDGAN